MNKKLIISLIIAGVVILAGAGTIIFLNVNKNEQNISTEYYLCDGIKCKNASNIAGAAITQSKCEICGKKMEFSNTSVDKLCESCSEASKKCKHCGEIITDEKMEENKRKISQYNKYKKIGVDASKIAYIDGTNDIILLAKNTDINSDEKVKLAVVNMKDYSIRKDINLKDNYLENCNLENVRLEYDNGNVMLFNEEGDKSFILNFESESLKEMEYLKKEQDGRTYFGIKDIEKNKKYYYFPTYDIVLKNPKTIEWDKYYVANPERYIKEDFHDAQVLYKDNEKVAIAYYTEPYGSVKLELFTTNGNKKEISELVGDNESAKKIILTNKDMVLCYDIEEKKEIWSYDINIKDKINQEILMFN